MWIDFAVFFVACHVFPFGIIRIVEAIS